MPRKQSPLQANARRATPARGTRGHASHACGISRPSQRLPLPRPRRPPRPAVRPALAPPPRSPASSAPAMGRPLAPAPPRPQGAPPPPSADALSQLLYPSHRALRARVFALLREDVFRLHWGEGVAQERERTAARIARLREAGVFRGTVSRGDVAGARRYDALIDVLALLDHSLEVKLGVNFGLFAASVHRLGSDAQRAYWLPRVESGEASGCFALTELGHGSNVRGIETQARYDAVSRTFEIHTPHDAAQKYWIGGAAQTADVAVVFAQLTVGGLERGIHVFVVPLRERGKVCPGVHIEDCGAKAGLNGVDNGRIWFSRVRVPRESMLSRLSQVGLDGTFTAELQSPDARFGAMLAALTGGRVGIAGNSVSNAMLGLTIAIRYSAVRRAFSPGKGLQEVPLLFYSSHQRQLMIPLATAFVYAFCARDLREEYYRSVESGVVSKNMHSSSAGYKALFTWFMQDALQAAREACGGQGYKSENRIAPLRADRDVMLTFEGANSVMMQQVGKSLLTEIGAATKNGGRFAADSIVSCLNSPPKSSGTSKPIDQDFIKAAFWHRESKLVKELGKKFAEAMGRNKGSHFHAWNDCLEIAELAAFAHMHRRIYDAHLVHLKRAFALDDGCGEAMTLCGRLWAANVIRSDPAFLRLECLSPVQVNDVQDQIAEMCSRVTGISELLLDGIGYPDHVLAPIAVDYVAHNARAKL